MREKLKYMPLAIAGIVTDILLFIGVLFTYLPFGRLKSGNYYSAMGAVQGGYQIAVYIMMIAAAVMIALVIFRILYYIMRERKPAILISAGASFVGVILILAFFTKLISMAMNISSLLYGSAAYSGIMSSTVFMVIALIFIAAAAAFDIIMFLCMRGNIKAEGLCKLMPSMRREEKGISSRPVLLNIIGALIFSLIIIIVSIRLGTGNIMGLISSIVTWAVFMLAGMIGIVAVAVTMFMFDRRYGRNKLMFINTIVNIVLGAIIILSLMINLFGGSSTTGGSLSVIILLVAIADAVLQIGLLLCVMGTIKVKGLETYVAQTAQAGVSADSVTDNMNDSVTDNADDDAADRTAAAVLETESEKTVEPVAETEEKEVPVQMAGGDGTGSGDNSEPAAEDNNVPDTTETVPAAPKEKFLKTKKGKITLGVIIAAAVVIIALIVWAVFFNKTEIDAFEDIQIEYTGDNGQGYAYVSAGDIDYDMNEPGVGYFVNSLYYDVENNGQLSNGDKVKITVQYSKATADGLDIKLKEESKEFEVSGLIEKYASAADIDPELYDKAYQEAIESAEDRAYGDKQSKFYKAYYVTEQRSDGTYGNNDLVFVFQETYETYDIESKGNVKKTRYIGMYTNFDSGYNEDGYYMYSMTLTTPGTYDYVEKEDGILPALQDEFKSYFDDYKINIEEVNISM